MRRRAVGRCRNGAILGIALVALGAAPAFAASAPTSGNDAAPAAKKKKKKVTCRATQLTVTVKGRVSCRAFAPTGPAADPRLAYLRSVLLRDTRRLRTRNGAHVPRRRVPSPVRSKTTRSSRRSGS